MISRTRNNDVYHMLVSVLMKGSGFYIISKVVNDGGHEEWKKILQNGMDLMIQTNQS